ncbi:MAG TPA: VanZ family protein [Streptomyces sp.]|nr:VanZ family protein [Streptomyces sp.]
MQRHGQGGGTAASEPRIRVVGLILLIAHLAFAGWLALRPLSVPWVAPANLHPFATIRSDLADGSHEALTGLADGLLLLSPLGVLLPLAAGGLERTLPGAWARTVLGGALISSMITLLQSGVPGHMVNVDSVLLNTAGVALTCLLVFAPLRALLRRRFSPPEALARRGSAPGGPDVTRAPGGHRSQEDLHRREDAAQGTPPRAARVGIAP